MANRSRLTSGSSGQQMGAVSPVMFGLRIQVALAVTLGSVFMLVSAIGCQSSSPIKLAKNTTFRKAESQLQSNAHQRLGLLRSKSTAKPVAKTATSPKIELANFQADSADEAGGRVEFAADLEDREDLKPSEDLELGEESESAEGPDSGEKSEANEEAEASESDAEDPSDSDDMSLTIDEAAMNPVADPTENVRQLTLDFLLTRVTECYPEIEIAIGELESARGKILANWGEFDTVLQGHSISQPLGFYQTYRNGAGVTRPLFNGGEVYGTYRIGDGNFEPWFGERETNEGGELKAGFSVPLLKDRLIDKRRTNIRKAELQEDQLEANVESRLLLFERFAAFAYWDWVASGRAVKIQEQIIELARIRVDQIDERIEQGDLALIAKIDNDRFIAKRTNDLIKAKRGLEKAAIKLSLFFRDAQCLPVIPSIDLLPTEFPLAQMIADPTIAADISSALATRPELIELRALRQEACISLQYANNLLLPKLDVKGFAGQDLGGETSSTGDKTPFELQLGVFAEVPIQRREGAGKIQVAQGKLSQIDAKTQFVSDKIRAEIQDAASAVNRARDQIEQSRETVRLNEESLRLGQIAFKEGDIDLLELNIYETSVANARLELLEAQFKYFTSFAAYVTITRSMAFETEAP